MAAYQEIHQALTTSIIDLSLGIPLAHEGEDFDREPNAIQQYISIHTIYNDQESLDKTLVDEVTGIYQLSLYTKSGSGKLASINSKIDTLAAYYQHNLALIDGSQCVKIINFGRNGGRNEDGWYRVDLSISFKSDIAR
jgi:hypothetical protein